MSFRRLRSTWNDFDLRALVDFAIPVESMVAGARAHWGTPRAVPVLLTRLLCRHPGREKEKEAAEEWCGWICCLGSWPGAAELCTQPLEISALTLGQSRKEPHKLSLGLFGLMREQDMLDCSWLIIWSLCQNLLLKSVYVGKIPF